MVFWLAYFRVNNIPTFIAERELDENREDLWELFESVGLDYYDRFEWLLRTIMRVAKDNLIVERRRALQVVEGFTDGMFTVVTNVVDIISQSGQLLVDTMTRLQWFRLL